MEDELSFKISADTLAMMQAMRQAQQTVDGFSVQTIKRFQEINSAASLVRNAMGGLAAGFTVGAFVGFVKGAIDSADSLNKLTQRTGISTEALSQYQYALKLSDVSNETFNGSVKKLNVSIAQGLAGDREKIAMFQGLGIGLRDVTGRVKTTDQVLLEMADRFEGAQDGAGKTAIAVGLLGRAGDEMIPFLNQGALGIMQLRKEADQLGVTISSDFAKKAEEFNDNITKIKTAFQSLAINWGQDIVDGLGKALKKMAEVTIEAGKLKGLVAGLQEFLTGDDQYKNNKRLVELTDDLFKAENMLALARANGMNEKGIQKRQEYVSQLKAELDTVLKYRKLLDETQSKLDAPAPSKPKVELELPNKQAVKDLEDYAKLTAELSGLSGDFYKKWELLSAAYKRGALSVEQLEEMQHKLLAQQPGIKKFNDEQLKAATDIAKARQDQARKEEQAAQEFERQLMEQSSAALKAVREREQALEDESSALALSRQQNITLAEAVELVAIARVREKQSRAGVDGDAYRAAQQEIEARQRLLGLVKEKSLRDAWDSFMGDIYRGLTDSLYRGFEAGKGFFQSFWDGIKNTLKTTVLKVAVQGVLGFAGSALGVQGLAQAGPLPGLFGAANTASGIGNLGNLTGLGSSISSFGAGFSTGVSNLLNGMEGLGQSLDVATSLLEGGNLAGAAGTAAPYVLAAIAAYKLADGLFGSNGGPKTESGYGPGVDLRGDPASAKAISDSISAGYAQIAQTLGLAVKDLQVGVASAIDTAGDSLTQLQVVALQNGQEIYNRYTRLGGTPGAQENVGRTAEAYAQAVAEETARVMAAALANSELPQKLKDYLAAATDIPAAVQTVAQVAALDKRLAALGGPLKAVADLGVDAQLAFVNAAGGLDALDAATQRLMSAEEQRAYSIAKIQQQLSASGFAVSADAISSATAQSLREVLAGFDLTTEGGRRAANALLGVSGAILDLSASATSAQAAVRSAADILAERTGLESQLYQLLGNTTVLRQRELNALDPGNRALQQHIYAVNDAQAAIESANTAYQQAQQAAQAQVSALESQRSAMAGSVSQLQQDMQRWVGLRKQASGLLGQIGTSLGGPSTQEADLWAQLTGGAELEAQLQAAQELYGLITQRNSAETQAAQTALQNAQGLLDVGKQLRAYVQGLRVGDLTALTPAQALAEAAGQYQATLGRAQGGDTDAQRALQAQADTYLRLAKQFDPEAYGSVFGSVSSQLDALGTTFMSDAQQQIALQQALVDAAGTANGLSADQLAKLQQLQGVVQGLYAQADGAATSTNAQLFVANANLASMDAQLTAARAAVESVASGVDAAKAALVVAQAEAAAYLASYQGDIANSDPVPGLLAGLPGGIASALAPLINGTANVGSSAGGFDAGRAQTIRAYAATLSSDEAGAMAMYQAAVNNGVSSGELEAALNLPAGGANEWAKARGLPAFALGGIAGPGDALVGENGPEVVRFLQPAEVYRTGTGPSAPVDLQPLLDEVDSLRAALCAELRSLREQNNRGHEVNAAATQATGQAMTQALERGAAKGARAGLAAAVGVPT